MYDTLLVTVSLSDLKVDQSELATGGDAMYCNEVCSQNATRIKIQPAHSASFRIRYQDATCTRTVHGGLFGIEPNGNINDKKGWGGGGIGKIRNFIRN